jgi:peptidoglycan hydrolase-like protein with peptidoglycan-binding domain
LTSHLFDKRQKAGKERIIMKKLLLITATAIPLVAAGATPGWSQQQPNAAQQANQQPNQSRQQGQESTNAVNLGQNEIKQMQSALDQKGYHAGRRDGKMGRMTEAALRQFQKDQGLDQSGQPDQQTLAALGINEQQGAEGSQPSTVGQGNNQQSTPSSQQKPNQQHSGANSTTGQGNSSNMQSKGGQNNQHPGSANQH